MSHFLALAEKQLQCQYVWTNFLLSLLSMSLRYGFENKLVFHFYTLFLSIVNCLYLVRGGVEVMKKLEGDLSVQAKNFQRESLHDQKHKLH